MKICHLITRFILGGAQEVPGSVIDEAVNLPERFDGLRDNLRARVVVSNIHLNG